MALAVRPPDIILRPSIPLSATSDQPLADVPRPPESASNDAADQASGTPKEISPEEQAAATAARQAPAEPDEGEAKPREAKTVEPPTDPEIDTDVLPENLPGYAAREIGKVRKAARAYRDAVLAAAKAEAGGEAWDKALAAVRDKAVETARADLAKVTKEAKEHQDALAARDAELAELRAKVPKAEEPVDPRPTRDAYDDPDAYDADLTEWGKREGVRVAEKAAAEAKAEAEAKTKREADEAAATARQAEVDQIHQSWQDRRSTAIEKYGDYVEVAEAENLTVSEPMVAAMMQSDNGTDVAYYLGQNPDEAERIAKLPNVGQHFMEIGRIAERLANPPRRERRPPAPIEPIDTSSNTADDSEAEPSMEAYASRRLKQLQEAKRPFFPPGGVH